MDAKELPALAGSPKQIAWAQEIRTALVSEVQTRIADSKYHDDARAQGISETEWALAVAAVETELANMIAEEKTAHWWIDNRNYDSALLHRVLGAGQKAVLRARGLTYAKSQPSPSAASIVAPGGRR